MNSHIKAIRAAGGQRLQDYNSKKREWAGGKSTGGRNGDSNSGSNGGYTSNGDINGGTTTNGGSNRGGKARTNTPGNVSDTSSSHRHSKRLSDASTRKAGSCERDFR